MKVLLINAVCGIRSTGRICMDIANAYIERGNEVKIAYGRADVPDEYQKYAIRIGNSLDVGLHAFMSKVFGDRGYCSKHATARFLEWADKFNPDVLWLHNIHDYYINIEMLFKWIKNRPNMQVKWTHHDCWAFTGYCSYFSHIGCEKWKNECSNCYYSQNKHEPFFDQTKRNYYKNKELFTNVKNMTMITPSQWLADLLKESFLQEYDVKVIHNRIDTTIFKPTISDFRTKHKLENKYILLGVACPWSERKGFSDFIKMADLLPNDYVVVLVGVDDSKKKNLPKNVIGISKTDSPKELAEIYTAADIFLNLTYEDNYPTTNLEAQACGTPVITYKTGGSPESVPKNNVFLQGDIKGIIEKVIKREYDCALVLKEDINWNEIL